MLISDLLLEINWWLILLVIGWVFLPLTSLIFKSFFDKGYIFSKIIGILFVSYLIWLTGSLKLLPFNFLSISLVLLLLSLVNLLLLIRYKIFGTLKGHLRIFILEEAIFFIGFLFWSYIKAHEPSIHGLEKFMDFGFINSILRSDFFPPVDMWLASSSINYYYFGHLVTAVLIKLTTVPAEIGYNLMLTSLFGFCLAGSFSIGANLYHLFISSKLNPIPYTLYPILSGLLSAFLVTLGGNLHTIYIFFQSYSMEDPIAFWKLPMMLNLEGYWYPNATRFIPFTIHEFPLYSFVVSDLHGHVLDIPFVLLLIALLIAIFFQHKLNSLFLLLISLLISTFLMTNFLDAPIYLLVISVVLIMRKRNTELMFLGLPFLTQISRQLITIIFFAILCSLPYWLSFKPFGSGIGVVCPPSFLTDIKHIGPLIFEVDHCARSPFWMLLILWGFPLFVFLAFLFSCVRNTKYQIPNKADILAVTFSIAAFILILIPEFFYVKDIYPAHYRANTVFKFGYQAFIILALMSGYMITRMITSKQHSLFLLVIGGILFTFVAIYPYFAVNSYFNSLNKYNNLNGLTWLEAAYPSDYKAITWINQNISGQPVILEAQGDSYSDFARVSANTGLPTVIGWTVHEWLWRGSYDEPGKRVEDVKRLYESTDLQLTKTLIQKYKIEYIFIGTLEKQKYTNLNEIKFQQLGKEVFENSGTKIYKLN